MSAERVEEIRRQNNNITVSRLFLNEEGSSDDLEPIPNPIEKFEQCFGNYPDLMGKSSFQLDFRLIFFLLNFPFVSYRRANHKSRLPKTVPNSISSMASIAKR